MKERHTYLFDSEAGAIQIGIPPDTIKVSMKKGGKMETHHLIDFLLEDVPRVYVLPSVLFVEDASFGEVEFPIFFNFFMK